MPPSARRSQLANQLLSEAARSVVRHWEQFHHYSASQSQRVIEIFLNQIGVAVAPEVSLGTKAQLTSKERIAIWDAVCAHLGDDVSVDALSALTPFSTQNFPQLFTRSFGTTVHQFVLDRMVDAACYLLKQTTLQLTTIAMHCGFSSHSHLTSTFSTRIGCCPSTYRILDERKAWSGKRTELIVL
jgi:transcriptional regulator GlxA family with amidase domain